GGGGAPQGRGWKAPSRGRLPAIRWRPTQFPPWVATFRIWNDSPPHAHHRVDGGTGDSVRVGHGSRRVARPFPRIGARAREPRGRYFHARYRADSVSLVRSLPPPG